MPIYAPAMVDERLDGKLSELGRELMVRPLVPGYTIADAFTMRGLDETGKPGLFAAVLLGPDPLPELDTLTRFRQVLTARLKQLSTTLPAWPIVVQGTPEVANGQMVVPGGREYFEQLKGELQVRKARMAPAPVQAAPKPVAEPMLAKKPARAVKTATGKKTVKAKPAAATRSARTARARTARR